MATVTAISGILGIALVSGVNLYAALLTLGLGMRYGWINGLPQELAVLQHPAVLIAAGVFYSAEFVADKVPFFSPIWDAVHTLIRPAGAALLALGAAAELHPVLQTLAVIVAGSVALGAHSSKMGIRLLAHTVPEPGAHSAISLAEDLGVISLLLLAYNYPRVAIPILLGLLALMAWLTPLLLRILRFTFAAASGWLAAFAGPAGQHDVHPWALRLAAGRPLTRVFGRSGPFPKLCLAYLAGDAILYRRWLQPRKRPLTSASSGYLQKGVFCDIIAFPGGVSFYLTKAWTKEFERLHSPAATLRKPLEMS
jgi:hypothetical protein